MPRRPDGPAHQARYGGVKSLALIMLAAATLQACHRAHTAEPQRGWITIKAGSAFTFAAPRALVGGPVQGIDSFVGRYDSEHFALIFDYGSYQEAFPEEAVDDPRFVAPAKLERLMIDGRRAQILTGASDGSGNCDVISDLFVADPTGKQNLAMSSCGDKEGAAQVRELYRSVRFTRP